MSHINPVRSTQRAEAPSKIPTKTQKLAERVSSLAKEIHKQWDAMDPQTLAEKIINLQDNIEGASFPGVQKMKKLADNFHFQFVFPIARDVRSFAKSIEKVAEQVLKTNSIAPFLRLSPTQQKEILRGIS